MRLSAPTEGFIWLDSISEIVELVTPERFANGMTFDDYLKFIGSPENLRREGFDVRRFSVANPRVDWSAFRLAVVRSTWDYVPRRDEFLAWADRVSALVAELGDDAQVGFHGHENLGLGVANSVEAVRAGAKQIDGSCRRFGAGAGNAPVEALIGVFDKIGVKTGIDFFDIADAAEEVVAPAMPAECLLDRNALIMGYSGVYSSFLKHAIRQSERYGVPAHQLLHRAGQRKLIGGQEDQLIDIALEIKREQESAAAK